MLTIMQLPQSDPSVQRIVKSLWIGHKKISLDTVLTAQLVSDQIIQYQRSVPHDSSHPTDILEIEIKILRRRTVNDLRVLLTYLIKKDNPPKTHWYSCFTR